MRAVTWAFDALKPRQSGSGRWYGDALLNKHRGDLPESYRNGVFHVATSKEIGVRLREARQHCAYSLVFVARQLGVTKQRIHAYENGERSPRFETASEMALLYNVSLDWIATGRCQQTPHTPKTSSD